MPPKKFGHMLSVEVLTKERTVDLSAIHKTPNAHPHSTDKSFTKKQVPKGIPAVKAEFLIATKPRAAFKVLELEANCCCWAFFGL